MLILVGAAIGVLLLDLWGVGAQRLAWLALTGLVVAPALDLIVLFSGQGGSVQGMLIGDGPGTLWTLFFCSVSVVSILIELGQEATPTRPRRGSDLALILLGVTSAMVVARATHLLSLLLGLAMLYLALDALSGANVAWRYFVVHGVGLGHFLFGAALLYGATGAWFLNLMAERLNSQPGGESNPLALLGLGLILGGVLIPLGILCPRPGDKASGAPLGLLRATILSGAAIAALGRLVGVLYAPHLALLSILGTLLFGTGHLVAWRARTPGDVLRGIALTTPGLSIIVLVAAFQRGQADGWGLVFYTLFGGSAGLLGLGTVITALDPGASFGDLAALRRRHPWVAAVAILCLLSLAGAPPTAGALGVWRFFQIAAADGNRWRIGATMVGLCAAWLSSGRWIAAMCQDSTPEQPSTPIAAESLAALLILASAILFGGLNFEAIANYFTQIVAGP